MKQRIYFYHLWLWSSWSSGENYFYSKIHIINSSIEDIQLYIQTSDVLNKIFYNECRNLKILCRCFDKIINNFKFYINLQKFSSLLIKHSTGFNVYWNKQKKEQIYILLLIYKCINIANMRSELFQTYKNVSNNFNYEIE